MNLFKQLGIFNSCKCRGAFNYGWIGWKTPIKFGYGDGLEGLYRNLMGVFLIGYSYIYIYMCLKFRFMAFEQTSMNAQARNASKL